MPGKGLRAGILDLGDSVMLGLASTAPVYSLAATLGLIVAVNGNYTPLVLLLGFIPVLFIAYAFRELNSAIPDCGTTLHLVPPGFRPVGGLAGRLGRGAGRDRGPGQPRPGGGPVCVAAGG